MITSTSSQLHNAYPTTDTEVYNTHTTHITITGTEPTLHSEHLTAQGTKPTHTHSAQISNNHTPPRFHPPSHHTHKTQHNTSHHTTDYLNAQISQHRGTGTLAEHLRQITQPIYQHSLNDTQRHNSHCSQYNHTNHRIPQHTISHSKQQ